MTELELPAMAYDGSTSTPWFTTGTTAPSSAVLTLDLGQIRQLSGVKWTYRLPEMDEMQLQVSADGTTWTSVSTTTTRAQGTWEGSKTTAKARYVRMVFTNPSGRTRLGFVSEMQVWGTAIANPSPTPNPTVPAGSNPTFSGASLPIANSTSSVASTNPAQAYDGTTSTHWFTTGPTAPSSAVLTLDLGTVQQLSGVKWAYRLSAMDKMTLQVSTDNATWSTVSTSTARARNTWEGSATTAQARYVRMVFNNPQGLVNIGYITELQIWGTAVATPAPTPSPTPIAGSNPSFSGSKLTIATSSSSVTSTDPAQAYDGSTSTHWFTTATTPPASAVLTLDLGAVQQLSGVKWTYRLPEMDQMQLQVSADGTTWTSLVTTTTRQQGTWEGWATTARARYVRMVFTNPSERTRLGFVSEVQIWGTQTTNMRSLAVAEPTAATPSASPAASPVVPVDATPEPTLTPTADAPPSPTATLEPTAEPTPTTEPTPTETPETVLEPQPGYITGTNAEGAFCRTGPAADTDVIAVLPELSEVLLTGAAVDGWQPVTCNGGPGYVAAEFVTAGTPPAPTEPPAATSTPELTQEPAPTESEPVATEPALAPETPEPSPLPTEAPPTPAPEPELVTRTVTATALSDTSVSSAEPDAPAAQGPTLAAGGEDAAVVTLTFDVQGIAAGTVVDAQLVLTGGGETGGAGGELRVLPGVWIDEYGATWSQAQGLGGGGAGWVDWITPGAETRVSVTGVVSADGTVSFLLMGTPEQVATITSHESGAPARLELTVEEWVTPAE
ncbi:MAG TPA: discoidin domain-containing protein [Thermomicrobiales bacterium]|nr:discoidin domain-containing protein [Thermomicrobiales bacterium]